MVGIADLVDSFFRLNPTLRSHMRLEPLEESNYQLIINSQQPNEILLPSRIRTRISHISLQLDLDTELFDLAPYPNCRSLTISGETITHSLTLVVHSSLKELNSDMAKLRNITLQGTIAIRELSVSTDQFSQLQHQIGRDIDQLYLQMTKEIIHLDLTSLTGLSKLGIKGRLEHQDSEQLARLLFPEKVDTLYLASIQTTLLDLPDQIEVQHIILKTIKSENIQDRNHHKIQIQWPSTTYQVQSIKMDDITLVNSLVRFSGEGFPHLIRLEFENHMNTTIVLEDLSQLESFKTSPSRFVIGHQVELYLLKCPRLQSIRTTPRITKYLWKCPLVAEFSQNYQILDERPLL